MRNIKIDMLGRQFGKWLVLEEAEKSKSGACVYKCQCECGTTRNVLGGRLRSGGSRSCGCIKPEVSKLCNTTHGLYKHPLYTTWLNIRKRCYDEKIDCFKDYGGRGITLYDGWRDSPTPFIDWCMNNGWKKGLEVDRRNNDGNYVPGNIRFITHKQQQRNTRKNIFYTYNRETRCLSEWAEIVGIKYVTVFTRITRGWTIHEAIFGKKDKKTWKNLNALKIV